MPTRLNLRIDQLYFLIPLALGLAVAYALSGFAAFGERSTMPRAVMPSAGVSSGPDRTGVIYDANILGLELPASLVTKREAVEGDPANWAVLGTFVGTRSLAMILVDGVTQVLFTGEEIKGWELYAVKTDKLIWQRGAQAKAVAFGEAERKRKTPTRAAGAVGTLTAGKSNRIEISRAEADPVLKDPTTLLQQALFKPALKNGKVIGFKIRNIQPGSILKTLGIENNDILVRINGENITGPQALLKLYSGLADAKSVSLDVERNGQVLPVLVEVN